MNPSYFIHKPADNCPTACASTLPARTQDIKREPGPRASHSGRALQTRARTQIGIEKSSGSSWRSGYRNFCTAVRSPSVSNSAAGRASPASMVSSTPRSPARRRQARQASAWPLDAHGESGPYATRGEDDIAPSLVRHAYYPLLARARARAKQGTAALQSCQTTWLLRQPRAGLPKHGAELYTLRHTYRSWKQAETSCDGRHAAVPLCRERRAARCKHHWDSAAHRRRVPAPRRSASAASLCTSCCGRRAQQAPAARLWMRAWRGCAASPLRAKTVAARLVLMRTWSPPCLPHELMRQSVCHLA